MRRSWFNLMEVVVAAGLCGLLFTAAIGGFRVMAGIQRETALRQTAVQVLDNSVERIAALTVRDGRAFQRILEQECAQAQTGSLERPSLTSTCAQQERAWRLAVGRANGRVLAEVRIPTG